MEVDARGALHDLTVGVAEPPFKEHSQAPGMRDDDDGEEAKEDVQVFNTSSSLVELLQPMVVQEAFRTIDKFVGEDLKVALSKGCKCHYKKSCGEQQHANPELATAVNTVVSHMAKLGKQNECSKSIMTWIEANKGPCQKIGTSENLNKLKSEAVVPGYGKVTSCAQASAPCNTRYVFASKTAESLFLCTDGAGGKCTNGKECKVVKRGR